MYFTNDLYFVRHLDDYKKFDCVRNILVSEYKCLDSEKLPRVLSILDDLYISFNRQDFDRNADNVKLLREDIFQLVKDEFSRWLNIHIC